MIKNPLVPLIVIGIVGLICCLDWSPAPPVVQVVPPQIIITNKIKEPTIYAKPYFPKTGMEQKH